VLLKLHCIFMEPILFCACEHRDCVRYYSLYMSISPPYFEGSLGTLSVQWQNRASLSPEECRIDQSVSHVEGKELVSQYCLVDMKSAVSVIEEHVKYNKDKSTEEFLQRLCRRVPHCFHPRLWLVYLNYLIQTEAETTLGIYHAFPCSQGYSFGRV
jgi:hypothetical protein